MTKLEQMIKELCPEGVEYKKIGEVTEYEQPSKYIVETTKYNDEYQTPVLTAGQTFILGYTDEKNGIYPASPAKPVIIFDDFTAAFKWVDFPFKVKSSAMKIITPREETVLIRYLFHCMGMLNFSSSEHIRLWIGTYSGLEIPVPPLEIQAEIVRILDNFTNLTVELTAELEARKKQYEHYKYQLLNFDNMVKTSELRDLVNFRNGKGHEKDIVNDGKFIVVNSKFISTNGEMKKYSNKQICPLYIDDILMVMSDLPNGKALSKCYLVSENDKYTLNQRIGAFHVKDDKIIRTKFLYYVLNRNQQLLAYDNGVDQTNLRKDDILNIKIPIPTLSEQERIVAILERFDKLCNDISEGLPAEIEARKKQYEYYRDRVLSFKER